MAGEAGDVASSGADEGVWDGMGVPWRRTGFDAAGNGACNVAGTDAARGEMGNAGCDRVDDASPDGIGVAGCNEVGDAGHDRVGDAARDGIGVGGSDAAPSDAGLAGLATSEQ